LVKSHYFFEFLHINQPQLIEETELEQALIDHSWKVGKAKDTPWDAVLMGSVVCTVDVEVIQFFEKTTV